MEKGQGWAREGDGEKGTSGARTCCSVRASRPLVEAIKRKVSGMPTSKHPGKAEKRQLEKQKECNGH